MSQPHPKASPPVHAETVGQAGVGSAGGLKSGQGRQVVLAELHEQRIAIHCAIAGRETTLVGRGVYEADSELGPVLRIALSDHGDLELRFAERLWTGEIIASHGPQWDYLIHLTS